jgi:hypothetical protein
MEGNIIFLHCKDLNVIGILYGRKKNGSPPLLVPNRRTREEKGEGPYSRRSSGDEEQEMR